MSCCRFHGRQAKVVLLGTWYSKPLKLLNVGDRIWVKAPGFGFVGVGRIKGPRASASDFKIGDRPPLEVLTESHYHRQFMDNPEKAEYFGPVEWLQTVTLQQAILI